ncbi:TonB-dependent receptor [Flavisolibacter ginsenosidimutans]|uniref:TonB-dependent receptor n=1 Tax=Flavisolibacter ginsenosidimutans TaxID=661481 RepID=A0A5B8UK09_9BACT|nr:TonB-dependent receptor [Flavisolibacter ginsenosidimutans]QEC57041.1 TonB-dependent receptor [Flavisolibacter ginsenosidimutans]
MRTLLLFLLVSLAAAANAQTISGSAKDDAGAPLSGATVALVKAKDTSVVKLAVAGGNGTYSFNSINQGTYRVMVSHVGYNPALSPSFSVANDNVTAPALTATKASSDLKGVTVSARKPMVEVRADKTVLNVEGTINAAGSDGLELLRKSPGVTVDKDENLSVNGKNGVQVYVDGRPTPLSGSDLANFLKSMQSSQIESIEIITNPSAKYEAAGNAGIINIRLKKNKAYGVNGSVTAGYAIGVFPKYNGSFNLNYRNKAWNLYGTYSVSKGLNHNPIELYRTVADTVFDGKGYFRYDNQNHNLKLGADYTLDKKSSVGVLLTGTISDPEVSNYNRTVISPKSTGIPDRVLVADNHSNLKRDNYNLNLNYNYLDAAGKNLTLNFDNGYYDNHNDQYQPNYYYTPDERTITRSVIYQMIAPTKIHINSGKVDYEQNAWGGKLGLGGKISFVNTDNDFQRYDVIGGVNTLDQDRSNRFQYKENINAVYANWNRAYKGVMVQAGLRVENTNNKGTSDGQTKAGSGYQPWSSSFERNYTNFFPSAAVTFNKNPMNQWSLTYSRRIDRPAYQDLNPFEFKLDEYTYMKGNIDLRPQFTNSYGITRIYKYRLTTTLNYSHISDLFAQVPDTVEKSKSILTKRNLAQQDVFSLNVSYPFQYKAYSLFANLNANYSMYKANLEGRKIDLNAVGGTLYMQNTLRFAKVWTAELSGVYVAPSVFMGTLKSKGMGGLDLGLQKQIFKGNGTIKVSGTDLLHTFRFRGTSDFAGQKLNVLARWESQQFKVNFTWRFGSTTVKAAKQKAGASEDEKKRAEQQGGGFGVGSGNN